jgi:uncharacterized LabA/DUF88 family protein
MTTMPKQAISTFVQVDLQNLFYGSRGKGQRLDFEKVWEHFYEQENDFLVGAHIYMIRSPEFDSSKFETKLQRIGYKVVVRSERTPREYRSPNVHPVNHSVSIAIDCLDKIDAFDRWVLMSGDGEFAPLCKYVKEKGKTVEVWGFQENHDTALDPYVNRVRYIGGSFFYRKPQIAVFGFNNLGEGSL